MVCTHPEAAKALSSTHTMLVEGNCSPALQHSRAGNAALPRQGTTKTQLKHGCREEAAQLRLSGSIYLIE